MILDLSIFKEETLDITMPDGDVLHIPKPTQQMCIEVMKMRTIDNEQPEQVMLALNALANKILNSNKDGKHISADDLGMNVKLAIVKAYTEFMMEIQNNPN